MAEFLNHNFSDSEDDDDFNPPPADISDNEDNAEDNSAGTRRNQPESDDVESPEKPRKGGASRRASAEDEGEDDAEEEQDDEEDDEEEEEEEEDDRPRKRHRRARGMQQFIDVEAEVDDEEEDEELEEDDLPDEVHPDDLQDLPPGAATDDRQHREFDRQRELEASMDAEKQAAAMREKYGRRGPAVSTTSAVPQHLLLPSVDDPKIWAVRVKPGKESEVINSIMKRFMDRMGTRNPLRITSAFGRGGAMTGYIYVEAMQSADVMEACDGVQLCYPRSKMELIALAEMPELLRTVKPKELQAGQWVRIKRPAKYAGDVALINAVDTNGSDAELRLLPRIDYTAEEEALAGQSKRKRPGASSGVRPPQALFNEAEAKRKLGRAYSTMHRQSAKHIIFQNEHYIDGFLVKDFKIGALETENVNPTLEEVSKFVATDETGVDNLDLAAISNTLKANASDYLAGDMVEIYEGEQQGVSGRAVAVHGDIVHLEVLKGPLKGTKMEAPKKSLRKLFHEGDHVKVVGGSKYHDEVGMVTRIHQDRVTLVTDSNNQEITVFSKDLREASDSAGPITMSKYDLYDLVQLDATTVACVIKVDRESLRVLDQEGGVRTILPSNISNKLESEKHAVATDRNGQEIHHGDTVKEYAGNERQGRVIHIYRNYIFLQTRTEARNAGVFVAPRASLQTIAARGGRVANAGPDLTKMNPALQRPNGSPTAGPTMAPPKTFGRDRLIGKTVSIRKGAYKGLIGIVKDTTETQARVELHTKNKIMTIDKELLIVKDPITGQTMNMGRGGGRMGALPSRFGPGTASRVPDYAGGSRTPMGAGSGGRTPAWGAAPESSRTPAWSGGGSGGRTPAWNSSRTPAWSRDANDGARTAYGDGSRTAYGGGGRTEYGGALSGSRTPFAPPTNYTDGSKTPAYTAPTPAAGGRTPAPGAYSAGSYSAPTPAAYGGAPTPRPFVDAPTPAAFGAPTPAAMDAPTPRPYAAYATPAASAPTPAAYPETPGAFGVDTPAGYGEEEDPRYE
ncbi:transcription elongation factor Spt5 [Trichodelitschia bisporula]|uniref:Transcription elongation factor SPT5 n=1 Tax=Trichodelitschia bisporula TaxID=703511 RepID=A0A6G1I3Q3_9PEZI|nr:transcription elongation factor Spt5 [Trichodelitschia bisporula]